MNNKPVHYGQFWIKKSAKILTTASYFEHLFRFIHQTWKKLLNIIQNNQKITIFKNTIAAQIVFALFGTKVLYCARIY